MADSEPPEKPANYLAQLLHSLLRMKMGTTVIHWEFTRRGERLSCQVDRDPESGAFAVGLVAYRGLRRASSGTFRAVAAALRRHAMIADYLRSSGWKLETYTR